MPSSSPATPEGPSLVANNLSKTIGKRTIVNSISFEVQPAEVFGFLGPNGAGKTTTIRMLVGLIKPTSGSVTICGHDLVKHFERAMRCVGCIVETPDLYKFMSGRENLEHFSRMIGRCDQQQIEQLASLVGLADRLDDRVRTYSLGMRQRLGIAQALLGDPRLLILDEPVNGLDPAGIREMRTLLRSLAHEQGISVFVSSHLLAEIELLCDRVAIIHEGVILQSGTVSELIASAKEVELTVSEPSRALQILADNGCDGRVVDDELILVTATEDQVPRIVAILVAERVDIYSVRPRTSTLEETFLEATSLRSVVDGSARHIEETVQ